MLKRDALKIVCLISAIVSIMEKRVADLERVVANQAMLIQSMQCQIIELLNQQKNPRAVRKGGGQAPAAAAKSDTRKEQKNHETVFTRCEYGVNCRKEFCKSEHQYNFCHTCNKHVTFWNGVDQFTDLKREAKILHLQHHKGSQYYSCWEKKQCLSHEVYHPSQRMVCTATSRCRTGHYADLSLSKMDEYEYDQLDKDLGGSSSLIMEQLGIVKKERTPYNSRDEYDDYGYEYGYFSQDLS